MLSRGSGAVAFQKIVAKVADLPSPLDAEPGSRIIVRETEEVYGLNATTRMWEAIGTLKKVGGKRPEELASHLEAKGNPHGTSLQDILSTSSEAKLSKEITLSSGPVEQLRVLSGGSALRFGADAGSKDGILWLNVGKSTAAVLRAVDGDGKDKIVILRDGSISSSGSASFAGGIKGKVKFDDEIVAAEGVKSAAGYDLLLAGDKGVLLRVGQKDKALLHEQGLDVVGNLSASGDIQIKGLVKTDLNPVAGASLGSAKAPWKSVVAGTVELTPVTDSSVLTINVPLNAKKPPLRIISAAPGDWVVVSGAGDLGLGTDSPQAKLDVRGDVLVGKDGAQLRLSNKGLLCGEWAVNPGTNGSFSVSHKGKPLFQTDDDGATCSGNLMIGGDLLLLGGLQVTSVSGQNKQGVFFSGKSSIYQAAVHEFSGPVVIDPVSDGQTAFEVAGVIKVLGKDLLGSGSLGSESTPWTSAFFGDQVSVGATKITSGKISHAGEFTLDSSTLVVGSELCLSGSAAKITTPESLFIGRSQQGLTFKPGASFEFSAPTAIKGVSSIDASQVSTSGLNVRGDASFSSGGRQVAQFNASGIRTTVDLDVNGLSLKKVEEEVEFAGIIAITKFQLPAGARVEAVTVKVKSAISDARFIQIGDQADADRFSGPTTALSAGSVIKCFNHWDRGLLIQKTASPIVLTSDAETTGRVLVTVHYVAASA